MKALKLAGVTFAIGVATGAGSLSVYHWMQVDVGNYSSVRDLFSSDDPELDMETNKLLARIAEQRGEIERLKSQLETAPTRDRNRREGEEELTEEEIEQRRQERREEMKEKFMAQMQEREAQKIQGFVDKYGLSEAQRQLLVEVFNQQNAYFQARREGEDLEPFNLDAALAGIMTDDQYNQYVDDTQKQIYSRADQLASSQIDRISQQLRLKPDQQQMMYEAINYTAQEMMIARQSGEDYDMRGIMNERLSGILTEKQLEAYQTMDLSGGRGGPGGGGGGGRPGGGGRGGRGGGG